MRRIFVGHTDFLGVRKLTIYQPTKEEAKMKRIFPCCLLIGVLFLAASTVAEAGQNGCTIQGSWMGIQGSVMLANYDGQSVFSGTANVELPKFDPTLGGAFPTAVKNTSARGMWERTGGNTFAFTEIGYGLDATGNVLWIAKNSGLKTLTEDCNLMTVEGTFAVFSPEANPFEDAPLLCRQARPIYLYRMRVDPPCSFD